MLRIAAIQPALFVEGHRWYVACFVHPRVAHQRRSGGSAVCTDSRLGIGQKRRTLSAGKAIVGVLAKSGRRPCASNVIGMHKVLEDIYKVQSLHLLVRFVLLWPAPASINFHTVLFILDCSVGLHLRILILSLASVVRAVTVRALTVDQADCPNQIGKVSRRITSTADPSATSRSSSSYVLVFLPDLSGFTDYPIRRHPVTPSACAQRGRRHKISMRNSYKVHVGCLT
jgi:hypothetical protein